MQWIRFGAVAAAFVLSSSTVVAAQDQPVVAGGAVWRYLDDGSDAGTAWRGVDFKDDVWKSGPARLGYGGDGEATVVGFGGDAKNKFLTTYFRHTVTLTKPVTAKYLRLRVVKDDGAVVYINGAEVWRPEMPAGEITSKTPAARVTPYGSVWRDTTLDARVLVPGKNVIAVEVHQANAGSSDIGLDLQLIPTNEAQAAAPTQTSSQGATVQPAAPITDGPYVLWQGDTAATVLTVCEDSVNTRTVPVTKRVARFRPACGVAEEIELAASAPKAAPATFTKVRKLFVTSDVEGEYDTFLTLLQRAGVIDADRRWSWGNGHLVLVGDMVDRGTKVTEVLWLIHRLEREAEQAGGRVNYVLGNHDAMLLAGDHRYVASKYQRASERLKVPLLDLFGPTTELGRWMRSKPVMLRIDSLLFTHGGIAPAFAARGLSLDSVNALARAGLSAPRGGQPDSLVALVLGGSGPLWYRGYFGQAGPISAAEIKDALARFGGTTIVVGHTIVDGIKRLHEGRVIAIDVTFKAGNRVQGVLIENGAIQRVAIDGTRTPIE